MTENRITANHPFYSLDPLTEYLARLETVTATPSVEAIEELEASDGNLTSRAVLFAETDFVHNEGYRVFGFRSSGVSDGVITRARLALHEPGSEAYVQAYQTTYPGVAEDNIDLAFTTHDARRQSARVALIILGGHLAVSGAFTEREIEPAYEAIKASLEKIGTGSDEPDFAGFGLGRISRFLFSDYRWLVTGNNPAWVPIAKPDAIGNIKSAWNVVGRPFRFPRIVAALTNHDF